MKAGEATWQQGILLKGNGLCHGISGNGLLLHTIARWHNLRSASDAQRLGLSEQAISEVVKQYRLRALMFARALSLESVQR